MKRLVLSFFLIVVLSACDFSDPVIEMSLAPSNDVVAIDATYVDPGCTISIDGVSYAMTTNDVIDTQTASEQTITYTYSYKDQEYMCYRVVKVMDLTPPTMMLNPGIDSIQIGSQHIDAGVTVTDNVSVDLDVYVENNVNTTEEGIYTITYTTTDDAGNRSLIVRFVSVFDPEQVN